MTAPSVSFEFFPPKSLEASFRLWDTVQALAPLDPTFVSVTYGAGGTTRELTRDAVATLHKTSGLNVAAHLTCVDASREETLAIADTFAEAGVNEIVALRGDPPKGSGGFTPHPDGFSDSCELISALAEPGKFKIRVGAYPEKHPEAADPGADVEYLKRKFDAGRPGGDHPVLLRGRHLLPLPRRLRQGRHHGAHPARHPAHRELEGRPPLRRILRHLDPEMAGRRLRKGRGP